MSGPCYAWILVPADRPTHVTRDRRRTKMAAAADAVCRVSAAIRSCSRDRPRLGKLHSSSASSSHRSDTGIDVAPIYSSRQPDGRTDRAARPSNRSVGRPTIVFIGSNPRRLLLPPPPKLVAGIVFECLPRAHFASPPIDNARRITGLYSTSIHVVC